MRKRFVSALMVAGLVAGCGGGGGDSPAPESSAVRVSVSGAAVKGPMARAEVGVYAVGADGRPGATALATAETRDDGGYTLSFDGSKDQPYVVIVRAKAGTTHLDEVSGVAQPLPEGFQMRALVIPASSGSVTTSATITPFSELAVAAAEKATGGISASNARQAESTVAQLLGFDPRSVSAKSTTDAVSEDEKKLAVMLTAVSKMASDGRFGCATEASAGDKTRCVVQALRDAASKDSIRLGSVSGHDAARELNDAITGVLADDRLKGAVTAAVLTTVQANLACTTNCEAAPASTLSAIAAARKLFTDISTDWKTMFSGGGASAIATGAVNSQAFRFSQEFPKIRQPVNTMLADVEAMAMGVALLQDFKAGLSSNTRGTGPDDIPSDAPLAFFNRGARGCTVFQDANTSVPATSPANANFVGCTARYFARQEAIATGVRNTYYRHGITLTPNSDGSFAWGSRARRTSEDCSNRFDRNTCTQVENVDLQSTPTANRAFTGTITPTPSFDQPASLALVGELPGAFDPDGFGGGSFALLNDKHSLTLSWNASFDAPSGQITAATLSGSFDGKDAAGATTASLAIKTGRLGTVPVRFDSLGRPVPPTAPSAQPGTGGFELSSFELDLVFAAPGASFEGIFSASDLTWDQSFTNTIPARVAFTGIFSTSSGGVTTDFFTGSFTATATGYANFDATRLQDANNFYTLNTSLVGSFKAPNRPELKLSFGASGTSNSHGGNAQSASLQYSSIVGGVPSTVVDLSASPDPVTGEINRFRLTEATSRLAMSWVSGATSITLLAGDVEIGTLDVGRRLITFKDHTSISLDLGL